MSLYDDIEIDPIPVTISAASKSNTNCNKIDLPSPSAPASLSSTPQTIASASNKMNLTFLKSQLEARKALLQNAATATSHQQKSGSERHPSIATPPVTQNGRPALKSSTFKLRPHRAVPLPLDTSGAFTIVPKALKEDKVFLFGEIMIEDEYNPTTPNEYGTYKAKREQQKLKEKIAKEIADRLARESMEEEEKRRKGAAIAPPSTFQKEEEEPKKEETIKMKNVAPKLTQQFGKGVSRGLGVAANIMSKMGYREGQGLGANKQGISRPLEVQRTGRNIGLILAEEKAQSVVTHLNEPEVGGRVETENMMKGGGGWEEQKEGTTITPTMELLKSATRVVLLKNILFPSQFDANFELELRQEMTKYGQLINVQFFQMEKCVETEAIRIFLEFSNQAQAIKAVIDLNGRFYGGRQCRATFYPLEEYSNGKLDTEILT